MRLRYSLKLIATAALLTFVNIAVGQPDGSKRNVDMELGLQHFEQKEYDKAAHFFQKLFNSDQTKNNYEYLIKSYIALEDYKKAEKIIKKQMRQHPKDVGYIFDMGYLNTITGDRNEAEKHFDKAIGNLSDSQRDVVELAGRFLSINELDYAELTYIKGKKKVKDYPFQFELAQVYYQKQDFPAMVNEYMELLEINTGYTQSVQNALQIALDPDPENKKKNSLRTELLKRIQKNANNPVFSEMLIWVYVQEKDFSGALVQAKALDKRNNEPGNRILALAKLSKANKDYNTAIECYEYVIAKGSESPLFFNAKINLVDVYNEKILNSTYTQNDLVLLENLYQSTLSQIGNNKTAMGLIKDYAHLQAFYLDKSSEAIQQLNDALKIPQITRQQIAECKIELADIYLISNEIWESSLLYSQVEKDFKYDQLGELAKFKNAKVFYYSGDFMWAKAQLDVLKGSTSKLISNDAMELSLLISDNTTLDTLTLPLLKYANADLLIVQNKFDAAFKLLDSIEYLFPNHSLSDEIMYSKYKIYAKKRDFNKAAEMLQKLYDYDHTDILADNALFLLAQLYDNNIPDKEKAMELYKKIMTEHADSIYVAEARRRFRELRGDSIN